jgi:hypothetical protein
MWAKVRKPDEPTVYEFRKAFGSWRNASLQAFPRVADGIQKDKEYLLKLVLQFDLWTYKDYILAHKSNPEVVPSYKYLRKKWESYRSLVELAKRSSLQKIMERYMVLWRKMGKKPTLEQCKNDGVQIDEAIRLVGSRDKLDELIVLMERQYEKQG